MTDSVTDSVTDDDTPLLAIRGLRIAFPDGRSSSTEVVHGIDLTVRRGQVVALVGESGSGKSVTALSVLRLLAPDVRVEGEIVFDGVDLGAADTATMRSVRGARIGAVFQEPMGAWNPVQTVGTQITEALRAHGSDGDHTGRVRELLSASGLDSPDRIAASYPHQLSGGQLQRAMVAMATSHDPDLLIADEPTTALDVTVQAGVLDLLRGLAAERGTAVLLITHDMGVVADLADEVVVLRDGRVVEHGPAARVLTDPRADYTRDLLAAVPRLSGPGATSPVERSTSPVVARLRGVEVVYPGRRAGLRHGSAPVRAVDAVDLDLHAGQTLGLVGESGSGKSTLGRCLTGLVRPDVGSVEIDGTDLRTLTGSRLRARQRQVGIVFQDPGSSLNPKHDVAYSISEPLRLAGWGKRDITTRQDELLDAVQLGRGLAQRYPYQLSGGQRQRVAVARALALSPTLLIADEPTSALDVSVQARVLELIVELQRELGFACLFVSHDLAVVGAVAHEVAVMRAGRIVERGPAATVLSAPTDDYTIRLLAAAPVADPVEQRRRRELRRQLV